MGKECEQTTFSFIWPFLLEYEITSKLIEKYTEVFVKGTTQMQTN